MYNTIKDFLNDWHYESESTIKVFSALQDPMMNTKVHENVRSAGMLAWHITQTIKEMMERTGLQINVEAREQYPDWSVTELLAQYKQASESLMKQVGNWQDSTLLEEDNMYGEKWKRGVTLSVLVNHQIHHRGQLEVIMRICGLQLPGIYGPAREEWIAMGMPAMQ